MDPALEHSGTFFEGAGCIECGGTGFKGRTAICELLDLSDNIREMILARRPSVRNQEGGARGRHAVPARVGGGARAHAAATTLREINKVTFVE